MEASTRSRGTKLVSLRMKARPARYQIVISSLLPCTSLRHQLQKRNTASGLYSVLRLRSLLMNVRQRRDSLISYV